MLIETEVEIDEYNRYPIGAKEWEIVRTVKTISYKVREIGPGEIFGIEELL